MEAQKCARNVTLKKARTASMNRRNAEFAKSAKSSMSE
jgi:hypothetical protein